VIATLTAVLLGLLRGLRHAFEPDHLTAVSTLVTEANDVKRGALLGVIWGVGHTLALVLVGTVLVVVGAHLPERVEAGFECGVAVMLVVLGLRAVLHGIHDRDGGVPAPHRHGGIEHVHDASEPHDHAHTQMVMWRPLLVGLVHGLAGSGALTAMVVVALPTNAERISYFALFGLGSVAGMTLASGLAGASLGAVVRTPRIRRALAFATGGVSIVVGVVWAVRNLPVLMG
jgi:hypothetical protein